jgi:type I restriction enzyme S subunit
MDMKPDLKRTEVGMIPEDWEVVDAGEIGRFRGGNGFPIAYQGISFGGYPFFKVSDMNNEGNETFMEVANNYISEATRRRLGANIFPPQTIVFAKVGAAVFLERKKILTKASCLDNNMAGYVLSNDQVAHRYVHYYLLKLRLGALVSTTALPSLSGSVLKKIQIALPPTKAEQEDIATALSDADALIESLEQLLTKKRHLKQGAMQELLTGKRRLPGFEKRKAYKQTEIGVIPEDWIVKPLGQRLRRTPSYGINAAAISFDSRLPTYLRITDITEEGRYSEATKASVDHPDAASYFLEAGDIVFARTGASVGKSYHYNPKDGRLVFAGFLIRLSPDAEQLVPAFLSFFAQSQAYWKWVKMNSMRSGQPGINGREYSSLPIPLPPTTVEQTAIASILSDMDAEITALEAKLAKARNIKQGMMQELLTGRVRLV